MKTVSSILFLALSLTFISCADAGNTPKNSNAMNAAKSIMEVTTFKTNADVNAQTFAQKDAQVEENFTSKQPGFITRQSGINEKGEYLVIVFWEKASDADASMKKFMSDPSVADYASMIDAKSMAMTRFGMDKKFAADKSSFVEFMSFDLKEGTDLEKFQKTNLQVETDYTGKRSGFLQRLTGINEEGKQAVAIYWTNKQDSDASLDGFMNHPTAKAFMADMKQESIQLGRYKFLNMELTNKEKVVALLNSFNTGDQTPISYINPDKYIQHNLSVGDGLAGFGEVMQHAPPQGFKANVIRAFEDGDYVFTHTEYDFFGPKIGFDIFKFEDGLIVEHWDNLIEVQQPNASGRTQIDGAVDITDKEKTATNKKLVENFIDDLLFKHENEKITDYINSQKYLQHNPAVADGLDGFGAAMKYFAENGLVMEYEKVHMILGEGNFVLAVSEGKFGKGEHTAYYDLFRIEDGLIVEHWDVIAPIPAKEEWKNANGKF